MGTVTISEPGLIARVVMMKLLLLVVASVDATRMLAFGDSWAWLGYSQFREVFAKHNISTSLHACVGQIHNTNKNRGTQNAPLR